MSLLKSCKAISELCKFNLFGPLCHLFIIFIIELMKYAIANMSKAEDCYINGKIAKSVEKTSAFTRIKMNKCEMSLLFSVKDNVSL